MPHLYLEYSSRLSNQPNKFAVEQVVSCLNKTVFDSGEFPVASAIKTRATEVNFAPHLLQIGLMSDERSFVHLRLHMLSGRSPEFKKQLSGDLLAVLQKFVHMGDGQLCDISVEMVDIDRPSYSQATVGT